MTKITVPGGNVLLSDLTMDRLARVTAPLAMTTQMAVAEASRRSHDDDEARWHRMRPSLKHCPFDDACRFV